MTTISTGFRRRASDGEAGFSMIEMLVALVIVSFVLLSLGGVFVSSKRTITESKQRQAATGLATRVIEQLRALPYDTVITGLKNDAAVLAADPDIALVSGTYRLRPSWDAAIDEVLQVGSNTNQEPLNPHMRTTVLQGVDYSVRAYVSQAAGSNPTRYWLTAVTTWSSNATGGRTKRVVSRSEVYSPTGCLSTSTHPFSGPCQASFYGQAGNGLSSITVRSTTQDTPIVPGLDATEGSVDLREFGASTAIEQVVSVSGRAVNSAARIKTSTGELKSGGATALTAASTDPSNSTSLTSNATTSTASTPPVEVDGSVAKLMVAVATDAGSSASTAAASAGSACKDTDGLDVTTSQPCGSGESQSGGAASLQLALKGATRELALDLASLANAAAPSRAFAARFTAGGQTWCAMATGDGCSAAAALRHLGSLTLGGLPAAATGDAVPSAYAGLIRTSNYVARSYAAAGPGSGAPTTDVNGSVDVWNGTGYETISLASLAAPIARSVPAASATYVDGTSSWTVTVSGNVTIGGASVTTATGTCAGEPCTASARVASPVAGFVTYSVSRDGLPVTEFQVQADFGDLLSKASYKAAPSA